MLVADTKFVCILFVNCLPQEKHHSFRFKCGFVLGNV